MPKNSNAETPRGSIDQIASDGGVNAEERTGEGVARGPRGPRYLAEVDFRKLADPTRWRRPTRLQRVWPT